MSLIYYTIKYKPYQTQPANLENLLNKLNELSFYKRRMWNLRTVRRTKAIDDNKSLAKDVESTDSLYNLNHLD